jgi:hypothetical protein
MYSGIGEHLPDRLPGGCFKIHREGLRGQWEGILNGIKDLKHKDSDCSLICNNKSKISLLAASQSVECKKKTTCI